MSASHVSARRQASPALLPGAGRPLPPGGVRAQELHVRLLGLNVQQAIRHQLVGHMARQVDDEAVVTE